MNVLLVLPILIPLTTAALSLLAWRYMYLQRFLGVAGAGALLGATVTLFVVVWNDGIRVTQIGGWRAPFGITLVADLFSAIMLVLAGLMGFVVALYSITTIGARREIFGYYLLLHILLMGVCGAFLTGDLFNLYVWFEVMLMASFVLLVLGGERAQIEGALKYVTLNLMSSAIFLAAVGILYGTVGTLNMADLAVKLRTSAEPGLMTTLAMLFLIAFGIKAAVFPLFFWLPASYHTPPVAVSAVFAGLLTKVGVYALIRVFTLLFTQDVGYTHTLLLVLAGLTMVTGVLGAAAQNEFRRILSFHIISQIGYMIMGLGLFTPLGLAGSVFYIAHHIIVKTNLFLVSGVTQKLGGSFELKKLGGLYVSHPLIAILFLIPAFALAGVPPLSGFFAKLSLAEAGVGTEQYAIVGIALVVGLLTLFSMTKIWAEVFWKPRPADAAASDAAKKTLAVTRLSETEILPIVLLAALTVLIGLFAEPVFAVATRAAAQLLNPDLYIQAILGGRP
jgi:multicomponent Na+:H+ antiporter subunit D